MAVDERVVEGIDAARRAGWRSYYETLEALESERRARSIERRFTNASARVACEVENYMVHRMVEAGLAPLLLEDCDWLIECYGLDIGRYDAAEDYRDEMAKVKDHLVISAEFHAGNLARQLALVWGWPYS